MYFIHINIIQKGETLFLYTDLNAVEGNILEIRKALGERELIAMVKADCYNHGIRAALRMESLVDAFGVCTVDEGIRLRGEGIGKPIKVSGFFDEETEALKQYGITPLVGDFLSLEAVKDLKIGIDIKFNSGMHRLGFDEADTGRLADIINENGINVMSLATHFAYGGYEDILKQKKLFDAQCSAFENAAGKKKKHVGGSAALRYGEDFLYGGVRTGIAVYGYCQGLNLKEVLKVTAKILAVRTVKKGERIGYGGIYTAEKDERIAVIRAGYYDGLPRSASGADVIINGKRAKLAGNICMDLCFAVIDGIDAEKGDEAVILGPQNNAEELANHCGTIPYEILTGFKGRTERIYT